MDTIASFCKSKGFLLPSSLIYGGFKGAFDYGPVGTQLKSNIIESYWNFFLIPHNNIVSQDGSILMNKKVWEASGHIDNFTDPIAISSKGVRMRADHLIENGEMLNCDELLKEITEQGILIENQKVESVSYINLMFETETLSGQSCYLRPETCQNIFVNAKLIADISRLQLPFGICQHGKVFRNEINPRNFVFRCREFEQLEMEYFYNPNSFFPENEILDQIQIQCLFADGITRNILPIELLDSCNIDMVHIYWINEMIKWLHLHIGLKINNLRLREHHKDELSHYSSSTFDVEYLYPIGETKTFKELCGVANRGNYDISQHAKFSKKNLKFKCPSTGDKIYPHVIEPSIGVERLFLAIICDAYEYDKDRDYEILHLKPNLCPIEYAIFPLPSKIHKKQAYIDIALDIQDRLKQTHKYTVYDQAGSIGRRYARQDGLGTKWCITIDDITIVDKTVTVRDRDTKEQYRVNIETFFKEIV